MKRSFYTLSLLCLTAAYILTIGSFSPMHAADFNTPSRMRSRKKIIREETSDTIMLDGSVPIRINLHRRTASAVPAGIVFVHEKKEPDLEQNQENTPPQRAAPILAPAPRKSSFFSRICCCLKL